MGFSMDGLDRELEELPPELRWREWMRRIEAVLFVSPAPVARADLARVVGRGASVDLLIEDLAAEYEARASWMGDTMGRAARQGNAKSAERIDTGRMAPGGWLWARATRPAVIRRIAGAMASVSAGVSF